MRFCSVQFHDLWSRSTRPDSSRTLLSVPFLYSVSPSATSPKQTDHHRYPRLFWSCRFYFIITRETPRSEPIPSDPVVGPALTPSVDLDRLCEALAKIEAEAATQPLASQTIDKEFLRICTSVREAVERLGSIRVRLKMLLLPASSSSPACSIPDVERFLGRLQQALQTYETVGTDSELVAEVERLRQRIGELSATYSEGRTNAATGRALQSVQTIVATILPKLDAEWPDKPIKISVPDLSIRVVSTNREDWLWEIGSGANWLAYHVAVSAALQRF